MSVVTQYKLGGATATEIGASVEKAVRDGRLPAGTALPTVRALATALRVSPTTVAAAYRTLRQRGLLATDGRRGTRISPRPPVAHTPASPFARVPAHLRNLADGNPDPALLPPLADAIARLDPVPHLYGAGQNTAALLRLAAKAFTADGIDATHLAIAGGALDGIERTLQAHLRPGDRVVVEDPGYTGILDLLGALGVAIEAVGVDDAGLMPAALAQALRRPAQALILTPRAQNPTGAALDADRVAALARVLAPYRDLLVVEDDHAGPVAGRPAMTLTAGRTHWAVVRSVSKWLGPDLRVALMAGDATTIARVKGRQHVGAGWVSHLLQQLVTSLWSNPRTARQLKAAATTYTARRTALLAALEARGLTGHGASGLNVWIPVREEAAALQALADAGFAGRGGERYRIRSGPAVRITTAALRPGEAERIAAALAGLGAPAGRTAFA